MGGGGCGVGGVGGVVVVMVVMVVVVVGLRAVYVSELRASLVTVPVRGESRGAEVCAGGGLPVPVGGAWCGERVGVWEVAVA